LAISQEAYILEKLEQYAFDRCNPKTTPTTESRLKPAPDDPIHEDIREFQSMAGSLNYAANMTRLDICFATYSVMKHMAKPMASHYKAIKDIFRYLKAYPNQTLTLGKGDATLTGFSDASYANEVESRRCRTGFVFYIGNSLVSWNSCLQKSVCLSTTESEYMALCDAARESIWFRRLLADLGEDIDEPTIIYGDNQSSIAIADNPAMHKRTKHIDIRYHYTRQQVEFKNLIIKYTPTELMVADDMTKALGKNKKKDMVKMLFEADILNTGMNPTVCTRTTNTVPSALCPR
jgi:hypothetical protein